MLRDLLTEAPPSDLSYDLCIVGAGAAGIALALEFASVPGRRVCLLEGGGLDYEDESQDIYRGDIVGRDYEALDTTRLRYFGGTTNHWAGYCMPLSENSFDRRPWIPHSGWPISRQDVSPYYERARTLLNLPRDGGWTPGDGWTAAGMAAYYGAPRLNYTPEHFQENALTISPVRMGERFLDALKDAAHIDVLLHANVMEVETDTLGEEARGVRIRSLSGPDVTVQAKFVVLAAGGLENVRLLLCSDSTLPEGLGNRHGLVGRFFADHINIVPGELVPFNPATDLSLYQRRNMTPDVESVVWHELTPAAQQEAELIPASVRLMSRNASLNNPGGRSLRSVLKDLSRKRVPADLGTHLMNIATDIEPIGVHGARYLWYGTSPLSMAVYEMSLAPAPNPDSRVSLTDTRDALGMRRLKLDWRLSEIDFRTIRWAATAFADAAAANGLGRSRLELEDDTLSENARWTWHHMCTTRMSASPRNGVVDSDCRIHGMKNLYVAGSSVFSTAGWGTPTFLIVALAQRLGDHLKKRLEA